MTRESAEVKARRYLIEGRLCVLAVSGDQVTATCRGGAQFYRLGHDGRSWHCSCAARTDRCAHLLALQLVTIRPAALRLAPPTRRTA